MGFHPNSNHHNLEVNHKDKTTSNNHASNLEWCTRLENMQHNAITETVDRTRNGYYRKVRQLTKEGIVINTFNSLAEAHRKTGVHARNICQVCGRGPSSSAGGYLWEYINSIISDQ